MKLAALVTTACVASVALFPDIVTKVYAKHRGCSTASLHGAYAHVRTGINQVLGGPIAIIGLTTLDGDGNFTSARESASRNGVIEDWTDFGPGGTYSVDTDCTGSIFSTDGSKVDNIVVFHGGDEFFLISTLPGRIITADWRRVEVRDEN